MTPHRLTAVLAAGLSLAGCDPADSSTDPDGSLLPFAGRWAREFEAGPGNLHTATYEIAEDQIRYTLTGAIGNADYVIVRDEFIDFDNRIVGHTDELQYYVVFVRDFDEASITLYKQEVASVDEGLEIEIPPDDTTMNHGWNAYNNVE